MTYAVVENAIIAVSRVVECIYGYLTGTRDGGAGTFNYSDDDDVSVEDEAETMLGHFANDLVVKQCMRLLTVGLDLGPGSQGQASDKASVVIGPHYAMLLMKVVEVLCATNAELAVMCLELGLGAVVDAWIANFLMSLSSNPADKLLSPAPVHGSKDAKTAKLQTPALSGAAPTPHMLASALATVEHLLPATEPSMAVPEDGTWCGASTRTSY